MQHVDNHNLCPTAASILTEQQTLSKASHCSQVALLQADTPLMAAARNDRHEVIHVLLAAGADVKVRGSRVSA